MPSKDLDAKKLAKYKKTFAKLAWRILECKFLYYEGAQHGLRDKCPSDHEYDFLEDKYKKLAKVLKVKPTASDHVGFPSNTPSGRLVAETMVKNKGRSNIVLKFKR